MKIDAVELRRRLVDLQFVSRDSYGREYRRNPGVPERFKEICSGLAKIDLDAMAREAKQEEIDRRDQRKLMHASR